MTDGLAEWLWGILLGLWAIVLGLVGVIWRGHDKRIDALETNDDAAHQRIYDKIESLRLENKQDHREARADIISRLEAISKQMNDRDALATRLIESLRNGT